VLISLKLRHYGAKCLLLLLLLLILTTMPRRQPAVYCRLLLVSRREAVKGNKLEISVQVKLDFNEKF